LAIQTIGIDGFNLAMAKGSGIATYARNLNAALRRLGYKTEILYGPERGPDKDALLNEIALYDAQPPPSPLQKFRSYLRDVGSLRSPLGRTAQPIAMTGTVITEQVEKNAPDCDGLWASRDVFHSANRAHSSLGMFTPLRFDERSGRKSPELMHWTCPLPLHVPKRPNLYTIHDLVPLRLPFATLDNKRRFLEMCRRICASAAHIVTVSEHSKRDIVQILGVEEARVSVTHQSVQIPASLTSRPDAEIAGEIAGVFGLDWRGYYLFFGAVEPKKNLPRIIEAYLASGVAAPLVIIGGKAWLDEEETQLLYRDLIEVSALQDGRLRRTDRIRRYEYLPFRTLVSLIRGARATLMPSLYEGFGLPVLESMLLGTPVIASTAGSLPEIAGEAALLVDPYDTDAIRTAITQLDRDADLHAELVKRGRERAARFSEDAYDARLADLYGQFS